MKIRKTALPGVLVIEPQIYKDPRGLFFESYHQERYREAGLRASFVQDNVSHSDKGVLRGLHYQLLHPQGKLVSVAAGEVFDVCVDIRQGSPTFGRWFSQILSAQNHWQVFVPAGFAHGFCVISETAMFTYKCTNFYAPGDEYSIRWDDPAIGIDWPLDAPLLSGKDAEAPLLHEAKAQLPSWRSNDA
ncbi:MAG: dTDP-4-dehydrorhamnose 3,5-epimerase [Cyanobacteria bacterium P01_A01_bin.17]